VYFKLRCVHLQRGTMCEYERAYGGLYLERLTFKSILIIFLNSVEMHIFLFPGRGNNHFKMPGRFQVFHDRRKPVRQNQRRREEAFCSYLPRRIEEVVAELLAEALQRPLLHTDTASATRRQSPGRVLGGFLTSSKTPLPSGTLSVEALLSVAWSATALLVFLRFSSGSPSKLSLL